MKGKSLAAACIIVPLAAACIAVYLYCNQAKLDSDRFGFFRTQGDHLVVQFGQQLVWLDHQGAEHKTLDLHDLKLNAVGDYAFFANGDLLVYHRDWQPGVLDDLARYFRLQKRRSTPSQGTDGFYRCNLSVMRCQRFASQLPALNSSFRIVVDPATDSVYLADTPAFKLYKLNGEGETLASSGDKTFRFPNQLGFINGELWVADTNHHRLVRISTATDTFAQVQEAIEVRLGGQYRWPHQFSGGDGSEDGSEDGGAGGSDAGWWVNVGDNRMAKGRIVFFNANGERIRELDQTTVKDPLALAHWQGALWLADYEQPLLARYQADGKAMPEVESPTLAKHTHESHAAYHYYQALSYAGLGGFGFVMFGGLAAAWMLERKQTEDLVKTFTANGMERLIAKPARQTCEGQVFWLTNRAQENKQKFVFAISGGFALALASLGLILATAPDASPVVVQLTVAMALATAVILATCLWALHQISQLRIGAIGGSLVLQKGRCTRTIARDTDLSYTSTHIMADGVVIGIGNPHQRFFDRQELEDYVFPRLKQARKRGPLEMQKYLWQARDPQLIASIVLLVTMGGLLLMITYGLPS